MLSTIKKSTRDLFDAKILSIWIGSLLASGLVLWGLFTLLKSTLSGYILSFASHIPFIPAHWIEVASESILGIFIFYQFWIVVALIVVGILADKIVDRINQKYYKLPKNGFGTTAGSIMTSLKANLKYLVLLMLFGILYFIPGVNVVVQVMLSMVLIKDPIYYDATAFYTSKEEFKKIRKVHKNEFRLITLLSALLLLIPFIGVAAYILQLIIFTHFSLSKLKQTSS